MIGLVAGVVALAALVVAFICASRGGPKPEPSPEPSLDEILAKLDYTDEARPSFGVCRKCSERECDVVHHAPPGPCPY